MTDTRITGETSARGENAAAALCGISKKFNPGTVNETAAFDDFSFAIEKGSFVSVVGSNGSGKTTLLNLIAGSILPDEGKIYLSGEEVTLVPEYIRQRRIGRVFQDPSKGVAPSLTVAENLSLAENKGKRFGFSPLLSRKSEARYREMLSVLGLGLEEKLGVKMGALSGGQRQSVSLLMATMTPVDLLILDEHTAALDPKTADAVMVLTDRIIREKNLSAVMVTHNLRYAVEYGTRLYMMDKGRAVLDCSGAEKAALQVDDILQLFNQISIECGN